MMRGKYTEGIQSTTVNCKVIAKLTVTYPPKHYSLIVEKAISCVIARRFLPKQSLNKKDCFVVPIKTIGTPRNDRRLFE